MDIETPQRQHYMRTFAALATGTLAFVVLQSLVLPALPAIKEQLHVSEDAATWTLTAYLLSASVATPVLGRMGDIHGKERLLVIVLAALALGTLLCALSTSLVLLIIGRLIQGLAGALFPLSFSIIRDEFPRDRIPTAIGLISMLMGIGSGLGIVLGGVIVEHLSIQWLFWIPLPAVVIALAAAIFFVPESPVRSPGGVNVVGGFLLGGWLLALLVAVSQGPVWGWTSLSILALDAAAIILFAAWVQSELRARHPLVDIRVMRIPTVWWTNVSAFLLGAGMYASAVVIPPFVETAASHGYGFGASPALAGLFLLPQSIGMLVVGLVNGKVTAAIGSKAALAIGGALGGLSFWMLAGAHGHPWQFFTATAVMGLGTGLGFAAMSNLVVGAVPESQTGVATGMNANVRTIGGAIGSQLVATILASGLAFGALPHASAYVVSYLVLGTAFLLAGAAALAIPGARGESWPGATESSPAAVVSAAESAAAG
jgi:EmrB/QacA subfamily drug resistance transporter